MSSQNSDYEYTYESESKESQVAEESVEEDEEEYNGSTKPLPSLLVDVVPDPHDTEEDVLLSFFTKKVRKNKANKNENKNNNNNNSNENENKK